MATTGTRLGELMDIYMVLDINIETNTITIDTQVIMDGSWRPLKTTRRIEGYPWVIQRSKRQQSYGFTTESR